MINRSKQAWTAGSTVKVGFMSLKVVQCLPTPGDFAPDAYLLVSLDGAKLYKFVPHNGVERVTIQEANDLRYAAAHVAEQRAAEVLKKASAVAAVAQLLAA